MAGNFRTRVKNAWDAFTSRSTENAGAAYAWTMGEALRPDRLRFRPGFERSIVNSIYNRVAIDVAQVAIRHVRLDEQGRYKETIEDSLNQCFTVEANRDQTGRALIQDAVMTLCEEGCIAIVPVRTSADPEKTMSYEIEELRIGRITEWFPTHVRVSVYNEDTGKREEVVLPKSLVAIVENPLYSVMNEPNSTLQRLIHKLNILDAIDEQSGAGKLDIIVQLPYTVKTEKRREQAEIRRKDIEMQLSGSKYGIAYIDGTEHVTQLNRPAENNLMNQITYLTTELFNQLGMSEGVFNGSADEATMLNYNNRTIEPFVSAIVDACNWKFLTKTARSQGQAIMFFRDPFRLVPVSQIAEIADKFTRNEILSSNEVRSIIGYKPSSDPAADELRNANLNRKDNERTTPIERGVEDRDE